MRLLPIVCVSFLSGSFSLIAADWPPSKDVAKDGQVNGRVMETNHHASKSEWGYAKPQIDSGVHVGKIFGKPRKRSDCS